MSDELFMERALTLAKLAADAGEVPVGAVVVLNGEVIGEGYNQPISSSDPTAHAELVALRQAARSIKNYRLVDAELYVTLEPCSMCAGAMIHARIKRVIFGTPEPKAGVLVSRQNFFEQPWFNHRVECRGPVMEDACSEVLSKFFRKRRENKRRDKDQSSN